MGRKGGNNKVDIIADQLLKQECRVISESSACLCVARLPARSAQAGRQVSNCWRIPWNVNRPACSAVRRAGRWKPEPTVLSSIGWLPWEGPIR